MGYGLPKSVEVGGEEFAVRYDFRVVLDIFEALNDPELTNEERYLTALLLFYPDFDSLPDLQEALNQLFWFINGGTTVVDKKKQPKLVDWQQDFTYIVSPINRVLGYETRAVDYDPKTNTGGVHWFTWMGAYMEIGDCLFAQIVSVRNKKARGKKLDKSEQEFYRANRDLIDIKTKFTQAEDALLKAWTGA